jgi:hypothetical protein
MCDGHGASRGWQFTCCGGLLGVHIDIQDLMRRIVAYNRTIEAAILYGSSGVYSGYVPLKSL